LVANDPTNPRIEPAVRGLASEHPLHRLMCVQIDERAWRIGASGEQLVG
jgi:hypothetical protein